MTNEEAINILKQRQCCMECVADCKCEDCDKAFEMAIESLENQKTGHWVKDEEMSIMFDIWACSECGCDGAEHFKYCSNCGARMEGVKQ